MKKRQLAISLAFIAMLLVSCNLVDRVQTTINGTATPTVEIPTATPTVQGTKQPAITVDGDITQLDAVLINLYQEVSSGIVSIISSTESGYYTGTGFVYDNDGHILTSYHVVSSADTIEVDFPSGLKVDAYIEAIDDISDLAVLQVDVSPELLHPLTMGESDSLNIGQLVVAIGSPFYLNGSMTLGIVSAKGRLLESYDSNDEISYAGDLIQTDAAINPGNSGGPLFNLQGEVVGLNRAISTSNYNSYGEATNSGVGFAVSANIINRVVPVLIEEGEYHYPIIGIRAPIDMTLEYWRELDIDQTSGVYVNSVESGGPADEAGLRGGTVSTTIRGLKSGGDVILAIDGNQILSYSDLISYLMAKKSPGDEVVLQVLRDGEILELTVVLDSR